MLRTSVMAKEPIMYLLSIGSVFLTSFLVIITNDDSVIRRTCAQSSTGSDFSILISCSSSEILT